MSTIIQKDDGRLAGPHAVRPEVLDRLANGATPWLPASAIGANEIAAGVASVEAVSREELNALSQWGAAFAGQYKDRRYYDIVEETLHPEFRYRYFVLRDKEGRILGIQPFFILDQDLLVGTRGFAKSTLDRIRKHWPQFLTMRTLMVGCVAGEGHLDNSSIFLDGEAAEIFAAAAIAEAKKQKAGLVVFKEFPDKYRKMLGNLRGHGFIRLPSLPMASVDIAYASFDDYLSKALSRATRKDLRRKFKAAKDARLEMSVVNDISPYIDEAHPLYLQVYERSSLHFEKLTKEYLCALGERMPDRTRFFLWRQNGKLVAFNLCMVHEDAIYDQYIGLDYNIALDLHLYHYTYRDIVSWCIANGYKRYCSNSLNYDPKFHLRMRLDPLDLYVRHRRGIANAVMKVVLPWLEPTRYDKTLKRFANYSDLRG